MSTLSFHKLSFFIIWNICHVRMINRKKRDISIFLEELLLFKKAKQINFFEIAHSLNNKY